MLQIGTRLYQPIPAQSGIHIALDPVMRGHCQQEWWLDAHFVPADEDFGTWAMTPWEHWCFALHPLGFRILKDWRDLARGSYFEGEEGETGAGWPSIENLIATTRGGGQRMEVQFTDFSIIRREGYLFTIEADGDVAPAKDSKEGAPTGDFRLRMEIPFASATVEVPLNAGDPLSTARAICAREIQLTEFARTDVRLFDPERKVWKPERSGKHTVTLETPWRG